MEKQQEENTLIIPKYTSDAKIENFMERLATAFRLDISIHKAVIIHGNINEDQAEMVERIAEEFDIIIEDFYEGKLNEE